jgi:hypothetical protein
LLLAQPKNRVRNQARSIECTCDRFLTNSICQWLCQNALLPLQRPLGTNSSPVCAKALLLNAVPTELPNRYGPHAISCQSVGRFSFSKAALAYPGDCYAAAGTQRSWHFGPAWPAQDVEERCCNRCRLIKNIGSQSGAATTWRPLCTRVDISWRRQRSPRRA